MLADLDVAARDKKLLVNKRSKQRQKDDPIDRAFRRPDEQSPQVNVQQDLFPLVQKLLHRLDTTSAGAGNSGARAGALGGAWQSGMLVGSKRVEVVSNEQLLGYLNELEQRLEQVKEQSLAANAPVAVDIRAPLGELLEEQSGAKTLCAVDSQSSDIIQLVTMLYEAIWREESVSIPIKELIGRTQITTLKVALKDHTFFESETHPVRVLLNELAAAGITWTQSEQLDKDPMYIRIRATVIELMANFTGDIAYVEQLIDQFRQFKKDLQVEVVHADSALLNAAERAQRLGEIEEYAQSKINERILDQSLHPDVRKFLDEYFRKFLVQVILREGPGGISWRPVMNTIDVLLWTVQRDRQKGDLERFVKVNTRLRAYLAKALTVAGIEQSEADAALHALQIVQDQSFQSGIKTRVTPQSGSALETTAEQVATTGKDATDPQADLPIGDAHLLEVDQYTIGLWFEFQVSDEQSIRCTLAAKIETIEKFVFVNSQGVKVIEKSRMGLARELKAGTVKLICDGPLFDRAMESVIAQLRSGSSPKAE